MFAVEKMTEEMRSEVLPMVDAFLLYLYHVYNR